MTQDNGIAFGAEGPMMTGTWVNPKTGHKFTVRDCFFQDNQFMVQTTDGQLLDYNTIQHYVQSVNKPGESISTPKTTASDIPAEVSALLAEPTSSIPTDVLPDEMTLIKGLGNINDRTPSQPAPSPESTDQIMIERVLRKFPKPQIEASILWETPERQIDTLVNVLGIESSDIADYYINTLNATAIMEVVRAQLSAHIQQIAEGKPEAPAKTPAEPKPTPKPSPKSTPTTSRSTKKTKVADGTRLK